ncbi:hypothetical protein Aduo_012997 [Ancylostoma duodenale]
MDGWTPGCHRSIDHHVSSTEYIGRQRSVAPGRQKAKSVVERRHTAHKRTQRLFINGTKSTTQVLLDALWPGGWTVLAAL